MPRDCTAHHWRSREQSLYVEGSHTNLPVFMSSEVNNSKGQLTITEVDPDTEATTDLEGVVTLVDSADPDITRLATTLYVAPANKLDRAVGPSPKTEKLLGSLCQVASAVISIPFVPESAVQALCEWAAHQLYQQGQKITVQSIKSFLSSGKNMVTAKINSYRKPSVPRKGTNKASGGKVVATPRAAPSSGGSSMEVTAPVSIGNVLSGKRTIAHSVKNGHVVIGREFLASAFGSGSIATWTLVSGMPLTPVAFVDSMLRMYGSMYTFYRWKRLRVHFVTTSPTSSNGSVMFYYNKDRASVFLEQTSANLLPFVLSDPHTTISPQWQNFSVDLECTGDLKRCDYGMTDDSTHYSAGEMFLLSRTSTTDSPGHILMDYEIEFSEQNLTPRLTLWPQPTIQYTPYAFAIPVSTAGNSVVLLLAGAGVNPFVPANTNQLIAGGIYKCVWDFSNGHISGTTPSSTLANLFTFGAAATKIAMTAEDGMTTYAVNGSGGVQMFENITSAYTNTATFFWQSTVTVSPATEFFIIWLSLVGFQGGNSMSSFM